MRKKTVNHLADTIFWYLLYFLPIISYLLFCFCEPVAISSNTDTSTVDSTSYSVNSTINSDISTYSLDLGAEEFEIVVGTYIFNDILDVSMLESTQAGNFVISFVCNSTTYTSLSWDNNGQVILFNNMETLVYNSTWLNDSYKTIEITSTQTLKNYAMYQFFNINLTAVVEPEPDIPIEPTLDIVPFYDYMISAYSFTENNFIYNTITSVFGENGVFNLALDNGIYLYFSWFIGVYLMHLFVDFILFIPRLCHKWLKGFTQGD